MVRRERTVAHAETLSLGSNRVDEALFIVPSARSKISQFIPDLKGHVQTGVALTILIVPASPQTEKK